MKNLFAVIGDIHGCYYTLKKLFNKIRAEYSDLKIYSTGDLIDRGYYSKKVIQFCIDNSISPVLGNHEDTLLDAIFSFNRNKQDMYELIDTFYSFGGDYTQKSYINSDEPDDFGLFVKSFTDSGHLNFFSKCPLKIELNNFILTHAGISGREDKDTILWTRQIPDVLKKTQIIGHTPLENPLFISFHYTNIDTGCTYGNLLTAGIFDDDNNSLVEFISVPFDSRDNPNIIF